MNGHLSFLLFNSEVVGILMKNMLINMHTSYGKSQQAVAIVHVPYIIGCYRIDFCFYFTCSYHINIYAFNHRLFAAKITFSIWWFQKNAHSQRLLFAYLIKHFFFVRLIRSANKILTFYALIVCELAQMRPVRHRIFHLHSKLINNYHIISNASGFLYRSVCFILILNNNNSFFSLHWKLEWRWC